MSDDSLIGVQLDEYRLEALLGRGGMARVYRGLDTGLNRYVAVKVIDTPFRSDEEYVKRFTIEAQAIARLDHPHVVRLYRYGEVNGLLYMAMQFIEGADLGYLLQSYRLDGQYIPAADVLRLITETGQALDYIHAQGIIHRDIKPSNILLTRDEARVVLTDFGLALRADFGTRGEVFGSPHYIAPEQAVSSARAVPQSDLYALGVILYEMFTGSLPFHAPDPMDTAILHMNTPPPPPRAIRRDLSPEVEAVILKALEKRPEDRYQSGRALALALDRALRHQPEEVPPTYATLPERVTIGILANPLQALPPIPGEVTPAQRAEAAAPAPQPSPGPQPTPKPQPSPEPEPVSLPSLGDGYTQNKDNEPVRPARIFSADAPNPIYPPSEPPEERKRRAPLWMLIGGAAFVSICGLSCIFIFLISTLLNNNVQRGAAIATPTVDPRIEIPDQDPPQNPDKIAGGPDYRLKFWRCDNKNCLVIENTGSEDFSLAGLTLQGSSGSLSGADWGVDTLQPEQCVKLIRGEDAAGEMPAGAECDTVGQPVMPRGDQRFWENSFTIFYHENEVFDCMRRGDWCEVLVPR